MDAEDEWNGTYFLRVGPTGAAMTIATPHYAFLQLIDEWSIRHIVNCTKDRARRTGNERFELDEEDLEKFIGILYLGAVNNQKGFPFDNLWSKEYSSLWENFTKRSSS